MTVRIEKDRAVWTIIHDRPEARNAMDPASADALTEHRNTAATTIERLRTRVLWPPYSSNVRTQVW